MEKSKISFELFPKTVYNDIPNLPDPVYLGITIKARNYDEITLYFQITAIHPAWTFKTVNLGAVESGKEIIEHLHDFGYRGRPTAEVTDECEFSLKAYTDPDYTSLKWESKRTIKVVFFKSDDGTWTFDIVNNFDDGTLQDWSVEGITNLAGGYPTIKVAEDYVVSVPYSCKGDGDPYSAVDYPPSAFKLKKTITTPDKPEVFAIINFRLTNDGDTTYRVLIKRDDVILCDLGKPEKQGYNVLPIDIWMRTVVPLPRNATFVLSIEHWVQSIYGRVYSTWIDDFKLISR